MGRSGPGQTFRRLARRAAGLAITLGLTSLVGGLVPAGDLDGTWRLAARTLPDRTILKPPTVQGLVTFAHGLEQTIVTWPMPGGRQASVARSDRVEITETEFMATPLLVILDAVNAQPPRYVTSRETRRSPITRQGGHMTCQHPTHPPHVVWEDDRFTATPDGVFIDTWERMR